MTITKLHNGLLGALSFWILGFLFFYTYVTFIDASPLSYENVPFPVVKNTVIAGEIIPVSIERCNHSSAPIVYNVTRGVQNLQNKTVFQIEGNTTILDPGCTLAVSYSNRTPATLPSGQYRLYGAAITPGTFNDHSVIWYSEPFNVVMPK